MTRDLFLAIDVGTGSVRAALVDGDGRIQVIAAQEHDQIVPRFGWSEQRPADWWDSALVCIGRALTEVENAPARVAAICTCGQMHGSVLIDADGRLTRDAALLWNDKRTLPQVEAFRSAGDPAAALNATANVPAPAWPAFKLRWLMENDAASVARASTLLMPKDWINFRLTGERAQDVTEASLSFLMEWRTRAWSRDLADAVGIPFDLLPPLRSPDDILGGLSPEAASLTGLPRDMPVLVGAGDFPMALLGSGVTGAGMGSDVTGTSTIITLMHDAPVLSADVSNVIGADGTWGAFTLLDAGGDAVRWARRAFHNNALSYAEVEAAAARGRPGAGGLLFLPYLAGERFADGPGARAQFFGLTADHGLDDLHRAVLEGVAFSVRHRMDALQGGHGCPDRIVAAGGGAKSRTWLDIKASMYGVPYVVPEELECGVVGAGILAAVATGAAEDLAAATARMVRHGPQIAPDPACQDTYDAMMPIYAGLYDAAQHFYGQLEALQDGA